MPTARRSLPLFVLACLAFAGLAVDLVLHGPVTAADPAVSGWFHAQARPALTLLMRAVSDLHATRTLLALTALAAAALAWRGQARWLPVLVATVPGGMLLNNLVKHSFQRARPALEGRMVELASYSFPSGHTAGATVWWGFALAWFLAHRSGRGERLAAALLAASMVLLTGISRIYLGAHYLSDVLAATAEGLAWLALTLLLAPRPAR